MRLHSRIRPGGIRSTAMAAGLQGPVRVDQGARGAGGALGCRRRLRDRGGPAAVRVGDRRHHAAPRPGRGGQARALLMDRRRPSPHLDHARGERGGGARARRRAGPLGRGLLRDRRRAGRLPRHRHPAARDAGSHAPGQERAAGGGGGAGRGRRDGLAGAPAAGRAARDPVRLLGRRTRDDDRHLEGALGARLRAGEVDRRRDGGVTQGGSGGTAMIARVATVTSRPPGLRWTLNSSPRALLVASYVVALAAFAGALYFLYRLVDLELGAAAARNTLWLIAFFPAAFVFGAPYPESLFLLLSVGAFYAARTDRWAVAGLLALLASATRAAGVLLLIPLALIYLYGPRRRTDPQAPRKRRHPRYPIRRDALWLGLAPLGFVAFTAYLGIAHGDVALAGHHVRLTEGGFFHIVDRVFSAVPSLLGQPHGTDLRPAQAIGSFGFLLLAIAATVGALRRLPAAYGVYSAAVLVLALSRGAVVALPRYLVVVFPLFMWGALASGERGITSAVLAVSATLLGVFTYQFATWNFVG